ncbi:MAG: hypothetical protein OET18_10330, partial [Desulfobacterales bacterium]|nr:hypothetical protein [Desulfobacterales bacterium]
SSSAERLVFTSSSAPGKASPCLPSALKFKYHFKNRVREGEEDRQKEIAKSKFKSADSFPNAPARVRGMLRPVCWAGMYKGIRMAC